MSRAWLAALGLLALAAAPASARPRRCANAIVGRDACATFGRWAVRHAPLNDQAELGASLLSLSPLAVLRADGTPATVGGGRHLAAGIHMRVLRALGPHLDAGLEILPGAIVGPGGTATIDGKAVAVGTHGIGHGFAVLGAHVGEDLQIGVELAGGFGAATVAYALPAGYATAPQGAVFASSAEARVRARWWLSRGLTVAASAGLDTRGDRTFAIDLALHFLPYDGR